MIRYDQRGHGLSDWSVDEVSLDAYVRDLEAVVEATGVDCFPLLGMSHGAAVAVAYAVRHPQKVTHLILYGGAALGGMLRSPERRAQMEAMATLIRFGWASDDPTYRQMFMSRFMPGASKPELDIATEMQRRSASPENAERYFRTIGEFDIRAHLPHVKTPTLVMHVKGDLACPLEGGRELASSIPGATFVKFEGRNHIFRPYDPAAKLFFREIDSFIAPPALVSSR